MTTSQPRQPKGQPVGGQFAGKQQSGDDLDGLVPEKCASLWETQGINKSAPGDTVYRFTDTNGDGTIVGDRFTVAAWLRSEFDLSGADDDFEETLDRTANDIESGDWSEAANLLGPYFGVSWSKARVPTVQLVNQHRNQAASEYSGEYLVGDRFAGKFSTWRDEQDIQRVRITHEDETAEFFTRQILSRDDMNELITEVCTAEELRD